MDKKEHLQHLLHSLHEAKKETSREEEKRVMIEKAVNIRLLCDYVVTCSYGDIVLIIGMLHSYVDMLDETMGDDIMYQAYYRGKFVEIADRLAAQIGYDYEKQMEKCRKKHDKKEKYDDIGEDAMVLAVRGRNSRGKTGKGEPAQEVTDQETEDPGKGGDLSGTETETAQPYRNRLE